MKGRTITILLAALAAAAIIFVQWASVILQDDFTIVFWNNVYHKVFTYGFPFRIVECAPELQIHTPIWQTPYRVVGNFIVFLLVGLFFASLIQRLRDMKVGSTKWLRRICWLLFAALCVCHIWDDGRIVGRVKELKQAGYTAAHISQLARWHCGIFNAATILVLVTIGILSIGAQYLKRKKSGI